MADQKRFNGVVDFNNRAHFAGNKVSVTGVQGEGYTTGGGEATLVSIRREGDYIETTLVVDLHGLKSINDAGDVIGKSNADPADDKPAYFFQWQNSVNGSFIGGTLQCVEQPATGEVDVDVVVASVGTGKYETPSGGLTNVADMFVAGADLEAGLFRGAKVAEGTNLNNYYFYFTVGTSSTPTEGVYSAGKVMFKFIGKAA